jgi:hypothetical protein
MKLYKRHPDDESSETPCPRCGVPVPLDAAQCAVCGGDPHETYVRDEANSSRSLPGTADDDYHRVEPRGDPS